MKAPNNQKATCCLIKHNPPNSLSTKPTHPRKAPKTRTTSRLDGHHEPPAIPKMRIPKAAHLPSAVEPSGMKLLGRCLAFKPAQRRTGKKLRVQRYFQYSVPRMRSSVFRRPNPPGVLRPHCKVRNMDHLGSSCLGVQWTTLPYVNRSPNRAPLGSARYNKD